MKEERIAAILADLEKAERNIENARELILKLQEPEAPATRSGDDTKKRPPGGPPTGP